MALGLVELGLYSTFPWCGTSPTTFPFINPAGALRPVVIEPPNKRCCRSFCVLKVRLQELDYLLYLCEKVSSTAIPTSPLSTSIGVVSPGARCLLGN